MVTAIVLLTCSRRHGTARFKPDSVEGVVEWAKLWPSPARYATSTDAAPPRDVCSAPSNSVHSIPHKPKDPNNGCCNVDCQGAALTQSSVPIFSCRAGISLAQRRTSCDPSMRRSADRWPTEPHQPLQALEVRYEVTHTHQKGNCQALPRLTWNSAASSDSPLTPGATL